MDKFDRSALGRTRVVLGTIGITLACIAVALGVDSFNWPTLTPDQQFRAILLDVALPLLLAVPLSYFLLSKLRQLAIAHWQLSVHAATDSLTSVLNRGAFTALVEAYLDEVKSSERDTKGALLIIDADNFKAINDRYGHDKGDDALRLIAGSVSGVLRSVDLVGRIGGEEFGVFLPGSSPISAEAVAERIRLTINGAEFLPEGKQHRLSVSIGGAAFDRRLPYRELFRVADQQLYLAKENGRNRVSVSPITHYEGFAAAAA